MTMNINAPIILGLDLGRVNTRASLFNVIDGQYRLVGNETAPTSLGINLGSGAGSAIRKLQKLTGHILLKSGSGLMMPPEESNQGLDQFIMVSSAGDRIRTALFGLSKNGSLLAGEALSNALPLELVMRMGLPDLNRQSQVVNTLVMKRPEIVIITGGAEGGAEEPVRQWIEITRLGIKLIPKPVRPVVVYAGVTSLQPYASRRLEPLTKLFLLPNLMPQVGKWDLIPGQILLDHLIIQSWERKLSGLSALGQLSGGVISTTSFGLDRMVRFLGSSDCLKPSQAENHSTLAVDLGGGQTIISAMIEGQSGTLVQAAQPSITEIIDEDLISFLHQWTAAEITLEECRQYLCNLAVNPAAIPETTAELAIQQALARYRLRQSFKKFAEIYPWWQFDPQEGLKNPLGSIILSGAALTQAPFPGQTALMLLDSLQLCGIASLFVDRQHLLPVFGVMAELDPHLPVQMLESDVLSNIGTIISPFSFVPKGKRILSIQVTPETGKTYLVDINQGEFKRLVIPAGQTAVLELVPEKNTEVGFGGRGLGGQITVESGVLDVVIDARGRPLRLPGESPERVLLLQDWLGTLGGR
jgi:hypothetical protein